jgi:hypothetical protein
MGALFKAAFEVCSDEKAATNLAYDAAKIISPTGSLVAFNDHLGHAAVMVWFDQAIAQLQE